MAYKVQVIGTEKVAENLATAGTRIHRVVLQAMTKWVMTLTREIKATKLHGGTPLHSRTGHLSRRIHPRVREIGQTVTGVVGTNVPYGAIHEFGGTFTVPAHLRTITQAWGRKLKVPKEVQVREHSAHFPERSFLRAELRELAPEMKADFVKQIDTALRMPS